MDKIMAFLTKYKNWLLAGLVTLLLIGLFVGGFVAGKNKQKSEDLKAQESALKSDIKTQENIIKASTKNADALIDSAGIYESFARKQAKVTDKIHGQTVVVINNAKQDMSNIDKLSKDSNVALFSKFAKEYLDSLPKQ